MLLTCPIASTQCQSIVSLNQLQFINSSTPAVEIMAFQLYTAPILNLCYRRKSLNNVIKLELVKLKRNLAGCTENDIGDSFQYRRPSLTQVLLAATDEISNTWLFFLVLTSAKTRHLNRNCK